MSMKKYLAERKDKMDEGDAQKEEVINLTNNITLTLMRDFAKQVQQDGYRMDTTDLMRVYQMWSDVNSSEVGGDGSGMLPGLTGTESDNLTDHVETNVEYDDEGNEVKYVSSDDLVNMSPEDIEDMIKGREKTLNDKNDKEAQ